MFARDPEVLETMLRFYARDDSRILDVTANNRRMWQGVSRSADVMFADIDPNVRPNVVADFRALPFAADTFDVVVFDPPHLPAAAASAKSNGGMVQRYGLKHAPRADNVSAIFSPFLTEAHRILRPDGLIFAKLKDYVHNHQYQWMLVDWINAVRGVPGLTPCDLIVKRDPSGGSLQSSKWRHAYHVRNAHCWWSIVRKGQCEPRKGCSPR
jgi:SAM-dependent methyltransferase